VQAICKELGCEPGKINLKRFSDGEISLQIAENVRGSECFVIQPTCAPANDNIMELILIADALKRASAKTMTAILPYFGYARQDRKDKPRVPISARVVARLIEKAKFNRVLAMDLHSAPIQGFFEIPVDHIYALPLMVDYVNQNKIESLTIVSPDIGGVVRARMMAGKLDCPIAIIDKRREKANESEVLNVIGDVAGRNCVIVDDMIDTAGTLIHGVDALMERGARSVRACATHGIFSGEARIRIEKSPLVEVIVTDTIPQVEPGTILSTLCPPQCAISYSHIHGPTGSKIKVLSVAPLFAKVINSIYNETSVSRLFV
jgi:ribose-phosphate pyrophosphokinase